MREAFGTTAEGETVERVTIAGGGLTAKVLTWGTAIQDLHLEGHEPPLVLGFRRFEDYPAFSPYFGATAGRCANRIGGGRFAIDGVIFQTDTNFLGKHALHGGAHGTGKRNWSIADLGTDQIRLEIDLADGEMGFPGNALLACTYVLQDGALKVLYEATTDAPTLMNLAHHSYFNLEDGGASDVLGHRIRIDAEVITATDDELIPTGALELVGGTPFDFRSIRPVRSETPTGPFAHDINYCVGHTREGLRTVARVEAPTSGLAMEVLTTEPGLQLYTGSKLAGRPADGLLGRPYQAFAGLALEAQLWPDAPNHPHFPSAVLRPGETYAQETRYRFSWA